MAHFNDLHIRQIEPVTNLEFRGRWVNNWFSNFARVGEAVEYRGYNTYCLEQAFVAAKNPDQLVRNPADPDEQIPFVHLAMLTVDAGKVKRLGSSRGGVIKLRDDWDYVNIAVMDSFLRQRWVPGGADIERLSQMPRPICEITNWRDNRWGVTINNWQGRDALGLLLEMILDDIQEGKFRAGAAEADWAVRQDYLVERMNSMEHGTILGTQTDYVDTTHKMV